MKAQQCIWENSMDMRSLMNLSLFSLNVDFLTPKVFRSSVAAELARRLSPGRAQTSSPSEPFHVRIPSLLKLLWLKLTFAQKSQVHFMRSTNPSQNTTFTVGGYEVCFERSIYLAGCEGLTRSARGKCERARFVAV